MKKRVEILKVIKQTAGGFHSWVESNVGIIRKPNNKLPDFSKKATEVLAEKLDKWWQRFWRWIKIIIKTLKDKL